MKKMLALLLCAMLVSLPVMSFATSYGRSDKGIPVPGYQPRNTAAPEPTPVPADPYEDGEDNDSSSESIGGTPSQENQMELKWVALCSDYEMAVPAVMEESYDPDAGDGDLYFTAASDDLMLGVAASFMQYVDDVPLSADLLALVVEESGTQPLRHNLDLPMKAYLYLTEEDGMDNLTVFFDGVENPGCHVLLFIGTDIESHLNGYVGYALENMRRI